MVSYLPTYNNRCLAKIYSYVIIYIMSYKRHKVHQRWDMGPMLFRQEYQYYAIGTLTSKVFLESHSQAFNTIFIIISIIIFLWLHL